MSEFKEGLTVAFSPDKGFGSEIPQYPVSDRIDGTEDHEGYSEKWASWLIKSKGEWNEIENSKIKILTRVLARTPDEFANIAKLTKYYDDIEEGLIKGEYEDKDVAVFLSRITDRVSLLQDYESRKNIYFQNEGQRTYRKEMGILSPEEHLKVARDAEENFEPLNITPTSQPGFLVLYEHDPELLKEQRTYWEYRSIIVQQAFFKKNAGSTDSVANPRPEQEGLDRLGIGFSKERLEFLFKQPGVLTSVCLWTSIISDDEFLNITKENMDNEDFEYNLRNVFLGKDERHLDALKGKGVADVDIEMLKKERLMLIGNRDDERDCPRSIWVARGPSFKKLRSSIRFWLKTQGRHLLIRNGENIKDIPDKEILDRARDAEQISWCFIYSVNLLESFNSRQYIKGERKSLGPSDFMCLYLWMLLHPQERFEQKLKKNDRDGDNEVVKENWSSLGNWGVYNIQKNNWPKDERGKIVVPKILREDLVLDSLRQDQGIYVPDSNHEKAFYKFFKDKGNDLIKSPSKFKHTDELYNDFYNRDVWKGIGDTPFVNYRFDVLRWALYVFNVFKKGKESEVKIKDLSESVRNLGLSKEERENLLKMFYGINPRLPYLQYLGGKFEWKAGMLPEVSKTQPDFFKDQYGKIAS